ncbi:M [Araguari virus]|uniref:M n=1 Tax=Araguari virus TaxID=352236 RepID=A0A343FNE5_9ORTO|nr:M [Araguari virus] [Araguari virus]ASR92128.1 M [Araguari virus] [Araguari virus]
MSYVEGERFPSLGELNLGMSRLNLGGEVVPHSMFSTVDGLASELEKLSMDRKTQVSAVLAVWVRERYEPCRLAKALRAHLSCGKIMKSILTFDKKQAIKTAKAYIERDAPPEIQDWDKLHDCAIGLLYDKSWGTDKFRDHVSRSLIESVFGEVEKAPPKPERKVRTMIDKGVEGVLKEKAEEYIRDMKDEVSKENPFKKRYEVHEKHLDELICCLESWNLMRPSSGDSNQHFLNRKVSAFARSLQPILDLNSAKAFYDFLKDWSSKVY